MKKFIFLFLLVFLLICQLLALSNVEGLIVGKADAVSPSPSPSPLLKTSPTVQPTQKPTTLPLDEQINQLKDRIASRVAELKLVERRGIVGTVTDVSDTQLTLSDIHNNIRFVDVDELTKFASPSAKEAFGISDIGKGTTVEILGLYNKQSRRILARFVTVTNPFLVVRGTVTSVDGKEFVIKIITDRNEEKTIDIETTSKTSSYAKEGGLTRSGFSKIQEGLSLVVVGLPNKTDKKRITASRVILLPTLPKNPKITIPQAAINPQENIPASTGSGKKLTPITR